MSKKQHIAVFTTASIPWMTGTAVNPLFRVAYLAKYGEQKVTLVIPWLLLDDQELVYPSNITFATPSEQEIYVRQWIETRTCFEPRFNIKFYPAKYALDKRSILPIGDITECIPDEDADIAVLEEPEHLNWYHHGQKWKKKFCRVIGIVHTNYLEYVKREKNGQVIAFFLKYVNRWVTHIYCHKIIRLSAATQELPRSIVCNVHGVNPKFLNVGKAKMELLQRGDQAFLKGAYYIGKMVWSKGYKELHKLLSSNQHRLPGFEIDLYGSGEDSDAVKESAARLILPVRVHPGQDHVNPLFYDYKVFINPSTSDIVCTTTAEALAMGKIVICPDHPSNEFFMQFPNCHIYNNDDDFVELTMKALAEVPTPLTDEHMHDLSWEAATERFLTAAEINKDFPEMNRPESKTVSLQSAKSHKFKRKLEDVSASLHQTLSGIEAARCALGAVPKSLRPDEQVCKELGLPVPQIYHGLAYYFFSSFLNHLSKIFILSVLLSIVLALTLR